MQDQFQLCGEMSSPDLAVSEKLLFIYLWPNVYFDVNFM